MQCKSAKWINVIPPNVHIRSWKFFILPYSAAYHWLCTRGKRERRWSGYYHGNVYFSQTVINSSFLSTLENDIHEGGNWSGGKPYVPPRNGSRTSKKTWTGKTTTRENLTWEQQEWPKQNKYRGGTSDATTSSSLIVPLLTMSVDDFSHLKTAIFGVQK